MANIQERRDKAGRVRHHGNTGYLSRPVSSTQKDGLARSACTRYVFPAIPRGLEPHQKTGNRRARCCTRIHGERRRALFHRLRLFAVMLSRSCLSLLSIKLLVKSEFPNSSAEKVVDVIITMPVLCCKVPVDHGNVPRRGNILIIASPVLLIDIGHILAYSHDLACPDRRMRFAHVLLVLLEVVPEHGQGILQAVDTLRVYTRGYICEFLKIKRQ